MIPTILKWPHEILAATAEECTRADNVSAIVAQMFMALSQTSGVGLVAQQIGINKRIIICKCENFRAVIINPEVVKMDGGKKCWNEGCMSFPDKRVKILRYKRIKVSGFDETWQPINIGGNDFNAAILQHEIDHLNGFVLANNPARFDKK